MAAKQVMECGECGTQYEHILGVAKVGAIGNSSINLEEAKCPRCDIATNQYIVSAAERNRFYGTQ